MTTTIFFYEQIKEVRATKATFMLKIVVLYPIKYMSLRMNPVCSLNLWL